MLRGTAPSPSVSGGRIDWCWAVRYIAYIGEENELVEETPAHHHCRGWTGGVGRGRGGLVQREIRASQDRMGKG